MGLAWTIFVIVCLILAGKILFNEDDWRKRR